MSAVRILSTLAIIVAAFAWSDAAHAQSARTWVQGTGLDTNPCSRTAPCKTFVQAYALTLPGGEINCIDAGAYGGLTITKAITVDCEPTSNGGVLVTSGDGFTIAAAVAVNLRGLNINGEGTGGIGINIISAATVTIKNCKMYGWATAGIQFAPSASGGSLIVSQSVVSNNAAGIVQNGTGGVANMLVQDSVITNNSQEGIFVQTAGLHSGATIDRTTLAFNPGYGLAVYGNGAIAIIGSSTVVSNGIGVSAQNSGVLQSFKDNRIGGNSFGDGTPINAYPGGPLN
jgi:Right handed beta helix region